MILLQKRHRELFYKKTKFKDYLKEEGNTIFVGGIHGVGKGHLCSYLIEIFKDIKHLSASEVLEWDKSNNKEVDNVEDTQNRLIKNLKKIISPDEKYLLDGHFCLLKTNSTFEQIPLDTFREINPILIILLIEDNVETIKDQLDKRDNKNYNLDLLEEFQSRELSRAKAISDELGVECVQVSSNEIDDILPIINRVLQMA